MKCLNLSPKRSLPTRLSICMQMACVCAGTLSFGTSLGASAPSMVSNSAPSPLVANVIKLRNANIAPEVIKAYVQNAPLRATINAEQIVSLHKASVPSEIVKAVIERSEPQILTRPVSPLRPSSARSLGSAPPPQSGYALPSAGRPRPPYASGGPAISYPDYSPFPFTTFSPVAFNLVSFNNSYPTYINGYPVYSGIGLARPTGSSTFNNSYPTYINGVRVYAGSFLW